MTFQTATFTAFKKLAIDAKFSEDRSLRLSLAKGDVFTLPPDIATVDDLTINRQIEAHLLSGDLHIALSPGVPVGWSFGPQAAGPLMMPGTIVLISALPFDFKPTYVTVTTSGGFGGGNATLATASSGGVDITSTLSASPGTSIWLGTYPRVSAGTSIVANRSDGIVTWDDITLLGLRLSI